MSTFTLRLANRVLAFLRSKAAWRLIMGLFLLEALWFVFSAQYPMAFDENYHFGLIQLHAQQWLPFFRTQPHNAAVYGAVVRDPSYLYHWLMSYPYRFVHVFTHSQTAQVIILRLLNVAMFAYGLVLYRRLLKRIGVSRALANSLFAVFVLIPVVPFLAATINYDNLFFLTVPVTALLAIRLFEGFRERRVDAPLLLGLVALLFVASLIKYPFLPVFAVTGLYGLYQLRVTGLLGRKGWRSFADSFRALTWLKQVMLVTACLLAIGLFVERYGGNVVRYHNPVPACNAVISQDECFQYGPYSRDYADKQEKAENFHPNILIYIYDWLSGMWQRLFFAINYNYDTQPPLLIVGCLGIALAIWASVGILRRFHILFAGQPVRQYLAWLTLGYLLVLFVDGFQSYARTGQPVAINGRYLIPFLPFLFAFGGLAWSQIFHAKPAVKSLIVFVVLVIFLLQGGGTMTFIVQSSDSWMWNNHTVRGVNRLVRDIVRPIIIGKHIFPV